MVSAFQPRFLFSTSYYPYDHSFICFCIISETSLPLRYYNSPCTTELQRLPAAAARTPLVLHYLSDTIPVSALQSCRGCQPLLQRSRWYFTTSPSVRGRDCHSISLCTAELQRLPATLGFREVEGVGKDQNHSGGSSSICCILFLRFVTQSSPSARVGTQSGPLPD